VRVRMNAGSDVDDLMDDVAYRALLDQA